MQPSYLKLYKEGQLMARVEKLLGLMEECRLCPRRCGVNRLEGERGYCNTGRRAVVASYNAHFGEEDPLVGDYGSGTIFLGSCNLLCSFCQNYDISHRAEGVALGPDQAASLMLQLAERGCHNINFVTPSHAVPQIVEWLVPAIESGLNVPLVYNSGGYDSKETLELLEGIFDIYMPDFKFWDEKWAERYCNAPDYRQVAMEAIQEMHRQVGDLVVDEKGIGVRGLLVRHLVLPNNTAGTEKIVGFLAEKVSRNTYINIMDQYRPCGSAHEDEFINRRLTIEEYREAVRATRNAGLHRLDRRKGPRLIFGL